MVYVGIGEGLDYTGIVYPRVLKVLKTAMLAVSTVGITFINSPEANK